MRLSDTIDRRFLLKIPVISPVRVGTIATMSKKYMGIAWNAANKIAAPEQPASKPITEPSSVFLQQMLKPDFGRVQVFLVGMSMLCLI